MSSASQQLNPAIAFVGPCPPPLGGVAVANINAQALFADKYSLEIFNTSQGGEREDLYSHKGLRNIWRAMVLLFRYFVFISSSKSPIVNIFVTSNLSFLRCILFILVARLCGKKVLAHLHSKLEGEMFLSPRGLKLMGFFLRRCHSVMVLSDKHKQFFQQVIPVENMGVLENFVFVDKFAPVQARSELEFLFVGRLTPQKGFYDLIAAVEKVVQQVPEIRIHVMGAAATPEEELEIVNIIADKSLSDNLLLHGLLAGTEKYQLYQRCAGFIFPSHFENSPMVLKEALAAQQVIICSSIDANSHVLRDAEQAFVFQCRVKDANDLAKQILNVCECFDELKPALNNIHCPEYATDHFAFNTLSDIYQRLQGRVL